MRIALLILSAIALAVALVLATGGDEESTVETTPPVTTTEPVPTPPDAPTPAPPADPNAPANGHGGAEVPLGCGHIAFNPSTDSGASGISAFGTDCATARAVARAAGNAADELTYEAHGFRCSGGESEKPGLAAIEWSCVGAGRERVIFSTS